MEEIQAPKKERKFLKAVVNIAKVLANELVMGIARKFIGKAIDKVGNKRQGLAIALVMVAGISYAAIDSIPYPITGNKQRLGWQTTGNGLVYRGRAADTITKPSNYTNKDIKAYLLVDTVNNVMYSYIASKGGWKFNNSDTVIIQGATMPFDSITFNTVKDGTVGVGEVEYNDTQGSLIQGLKGGLVTNVIGQQLHQRVNNRTGATLNKGDVVYLSGSQGNRITVAKAIATSDPTSANTFGIVVESIADNQSGYVITEGLITNINTSALTADSAVYLSGTTAGALTSTKPQEPIHGVYIGVCVKSNAGSGELFVKIRNGQELDELHDVRITSPVDRASLYYKSSEKLWRDTTAALLESDTASMLAPYFKDLDTTSLNLTSRFAAKLNISDTASMITNYLRTGVAASTYLTQSNAASTYLPLTGGTLIGSLDINTNDGGNNFQDSTLKITYNQSSLGVNQNVTGIYSSVNTTGYTSTGILSEASTIYSTAIGVKGKATQSDINGPGVAYGIVGEIAASGSGSNGSTYAGYFNNTSTVGGNNYGLFVNTASGGDYGIYQTGTGVNYFGSNSIFGGNIGIGNNNPTVALDILKSTSSTSAKIRLSTDFQAAIRTLELSSGDGLSWDLPAPTSQSPFIKVIGGDQSVGGGGLNLMTNDISRLFIRQNGTIGIGTITPSATFEVHGSAVFNEGSTDSDFRVESDGNVNMVFVDASTDRVGIGTNAPSKTLEVSGTFNATGDITEGGNNVLTNLDTASLSSRIDLKLNKTDTASLSTRINGKVSLTGDEYINGQKTFGGLIIPSNGMQLTATGNNSNKLIGINTSSYVGEVTLGTGLSITSNVLNVTIPTERYYFDLGIIAGAADNSASTYDFTYGSNIFIVPTSLNGYCIDSVYIRAIGCSTCPPVAGDKDYYVGVYKANAGSRVTVSGATLVGSQITMNEYDLNEVNRNDTLSTGEAWWVYLNGTYTSDLAYVTAGFIVKKTCN